jgi:hypothetical protein
MVWGAEKGLLRGIILCFTLLSLGVFMGIWFSEMVLKSAEMPSSLSPFSSFSSLSSLSLDNLGRSAEVVSPFDHVSDDKIKVYSDKVIIELDDPSWASFTDTNSMDPVLDSGANSIEIKPTSESDIKVGDIISFKTAYSSGIIIHRVAEIGYDENGIFYLTKGDNNPTVDPGKRRFEDVVGIVVGVIY